MGAQAVEQHLALGTVRIIEMEIIKMMIMMMVSLIINMTSLVIIRETFVILHSNFTPYAHMLYENIWIGVIDNGFGNSTAIAPICYQCIILHASAELYVVKH